MLSNTYFTGLLGLDVWIVFNEIAKMNPSMAFCTFFATISVKISQLQRKFCSVSGLNC